MRWQGIYSENYCALNGRLDGSVQPGKAKIYILLIPRISYTRSSPSIMTGFMTRLSRGLLVDLQIDSDASAMASFTTLRTHLIANLLKHRCQVLEFGMPREPTNLCRDPTSSDHEAQESCTTRGTGGSSCPGMIRLRGLPQIQRFTELRQKKPMAVPGTMVPRFVLYMSGCTPHYLIYEHLHFVEFTFSILRCYSWINRTAPRIHTA